MPSFLVKIALGGGCHWCTEAVFQSLIGVEKVEQGYVASKREHSNFSEAVVVHFKPKAITLNKLIEIHLNTHKSTANHSMRDKYRSAVYTYSEDQKKEAIKIIENLQADFNNQIITKEYPFKAFKASREALHNYYLKDPQKPFCKTFIAPKIKILLEQFLVNVEPLKYKGSI